MNFRHNGFDLWVFRRSDVGTRFLLLESSKEKAEKWFNSRQFWQIPSDFVESGESVQQVLQRELSRFRLKPESFWAVEHSYCIYNRRYADVILYSVFAAEVSGTEDVALGWEHSRYRWCSGDDAMDMVTFRGLKEGLQWLRTHIADRPRGHEVQELRLA
jgi:ADP-ribose pyrophosphatase YjhB (NUDIX family)